MDGEEGWVWPKWGMSSPNTNRSITKLETKVEDWVDTMEVDDHVAGAVQDQVAPDIGDQVAVVVGDQDDAEVGDQVLVVVGDQVVVEINDQVVAVHGDPIVVVHGDQGVEDNKGEEDNKERGETKMKATTLEETMEKKVLVAHLGFGKVVLAVDDLLVQHSVREGCV